MAKAWLYCRLLTISRSSLRCLPQSIAQSIAPFRLTDSAVFHLLVSMPAKSYLLYPIFSYVSFVRAIAQLIDQFTSPLVARHHCSIDFAPRTYRRMYRLVAWSIHSASSHCSLDRLLHRCFKRSSALPAPSIIFSFGLAITHPMDPLVCFSTRSPAGFVTQSIYTILSMGLSIVPSFECWLPISSLTESLTPHITASVILNSIVHSIARSWLHSVYFFFASSGPYSTVCSTFHWSVARRRPIAHSVIRFISHLVRLFWPMTFLCIKRFVRFVTPFNDSFQHSYWRSFLLRLFHCPFYCSLSSLTSLSVHCWLHQSPISRDSFGSIRTAASAASAASASSLILYCIFHCSLDIRSIFIAI